MDKLVVMLRAAGDPTRLRLLLLLRQAELTVSELIEIVGQSQPRVSRHLKLLCEAGLMERFKEGSWVFYRAADAGQGRRTGRGRWRRLADPAPDRDRPDAAGACARGARRCSRRLFQGQCRGMGTHPRPACAGKGCRRRRSCASSTAKPIENLLDAGTGTGRMLELLAPHAKRAVGIDVSPEMLAIARDRLMRANLAQVPGAAGRYLSPALSRAARASRLRCRAVPSGAALSRRSRRGGGRSRAGDARRAGGLLIADFAPHELEFLRDDYAHRRLGFSDREVKGWFDAAGLKPPATAKPSRPMPVRRRKTHRQTLAGQASAKARSGGGMSLASMITDATPASPCRSNSSPPKTDEAEEQLWARDQAAGAAGAGFRLGHLWRGRFDARAHPCHRQAHCRGDDR